MDKRKIAVIRPKSDGVFYHRFEMPLSLLTDFEFEVIEGFHNTECRPEQYDAIILNRGLRNQEIAWLIHAKKQGVKIIVDLDDSIKLPTSHPSYNHFLEYHKEHHIKQCLTLSDVVWVTNEMVYSQAKQFNKNVHIVPNALNYSEQQWNVPRTHEYFMGGSFGVAHYQDLIEFESKAPQGVVLAGYSENGYWKEVEKKYKGKAQFIQALERYEYGVVYSKLDVAFAYLGVRFWEFNKFKSNLKMLEAGAYRLPFIATLSDPYYEMPPSCGYLCSNKSEWLTAIKKLKDPKRRIEKGMALQEYTKKKYDLNKINKLRYDTIKH
jgi:hypothetical protein